MGRLSDVVVAQIESTVWSEESALSALGKGIFFAPEVGLSYLIGKNIAAFLAEHPTFSPLFWDREMSIDPRSPCDLVLRSANAINCVVEFKLARGDCDYLSDVKKLAAMREVECRLFCALVDAFVSVGANDPRIVSLENQCRSLGITLHRLGCWQPFQTKQASGNTARCCVTAIWEVNPQG